MSPDREHPGEFSDPDKKAPELDEADIKVIQDALKSCLDPQSWDCPDSEKKDICDLTEEEFNERLAGVKAYYLFDDIVRELNEEGVHGEAGRLVFRIGVEYALIEYRAHTQQGQNVSESEAEEILDRAINFRFKTEEDRRLAKFAIKRSLEIS